jgi:hypothetical protein
MRGRRRTVGYRTPGYEPGYPVQYALGWRTFALGCLAWLVIGVPVLACALGWALR